MADLTVVASRVALVKVDDEHQMTLPAAAATTAGALCYQDTAGKWALADADTAAQVNGLVGISVNDAEVANETITCAIVGAVVDMGDALDALSYGAAVYASNVAGAVGDAAGTTSRVVGRVVAAWGSTTADKLLLLV